MKIMLDSVRIQVEIKEHRDVGLLKTTGVKARVLVPYKVVLVNDKNLIEIEVPADFETDFVSVPPLFQTIVPKIGSGFTIASLVHDFLYRNVDHELSRQDSDKIFKELAIHNGANRIRANLAYVFLRLFGFRSWDKNRKV